MNSRDTRRAAISWEPLKPQLPAISEKESVVVRIAESFHFKILSVLDIVSEVKATFLGT